MISYGDVIQACKEAGVEPMQICVVGQQLATRDAMRALESAKHRVLASLAKRIALTDAMVHDGPAQVTSLDSCINLMPWDGGPQSYGLSAIVQKNSRTGLMSEPRLDRDVFPNRPDPNVYPDFDATPQEAVARVRDHKHPSNRNGKAV